MRAEKKAPTLFFLFGFVLTCFCFPASTLYLAVSRLLALSERARAVISVRRRPRPKNNSLTPSRLPTRCHSLPLPSPPRAFVAISWVVRQPASLAPLFIVGNCLSRNAGVRSTDILLCYVHGLALASLSISFDLLCIGTTNCMYISTHCLRYVACCCLWFSVMCVLFSLCLCVVLPLILRFFVAELLFHGFFVSSLSPPHSYLRMLGQLSET